MDVVKINFNLITPSAEEWRIIEESYDGTVYKTRAWFDYLTFQHCLPFIVQISTERVIGFFIGEKKWRGVWQLGAPLEGFGTGNQGLSMIVEVGASDRIMIYEALAKWVFKNHYADWIQVEDWELSMTDLEGRNIRFEGHDTSWIDLTENEDVLYDKMDNKSCKYKIRKAIREGVVIRETNDEEEFLDIHYKQCLSVMHSKGLEPRRDKKHLREMIHLLYPHHMLLLEAVAPNGEVVATGMYAVNGRSSSSFSSASYRDYSYLCANEYIRWEAIKRCKALGARFFNNNGCMPFKLKFGSNRAYKPRLIFTKHPWLVSVRDLVSLLYHKIWRYIKYGTRRRKSV